MEQLFQEIEKEEVRIMGSVEQRPALRGINPRMTEIKGHPFVQVDLQRDRTEPAGHLFIPRNKVPPEVLERIGREQVEALALNNPEGSWEITDVQLRPASSSK